MRLSEAIRLGAMLKPKGIGAFYERGHTCALGAACDAIGQLVTRSSAPQYDLVAAEWPVTETFVTHPVCSLRSPMWRAIEDLNDCHGWTREQIADWVETIEAQHDAAPQQTSKEALTWR